MSKILLISRLTSPAILAMALLVSTSAVVARNVSDLHRSKSILPESQVPVQIACGHFHSLKIFSEDTVNSSLALSPSENQSTASNQSQNLEKPFNEKFLNNFFKKHGYADSENLYQVRHNHLSVVITHFSSRDLSILRQLTMGYKPPCSL